MIKNFLRGIRNLYTYWDVIWKDDWWDWYGMLKVWERQFRVRAEHFAKQGCHVNAHKDAKRLLICAALCRRILEDAYIGAPGTSARWAVHCGEQQARDAELLGKIIGKYSLGWWD